MNVQDKVENKTDLNTQEGRGVFATNLKICLDLTGLSIDTLSKKTGVDVQMIDMILEGLHGGLNWNVAGKLVQPLHVPPVVLTVQYADEKQAREALAEILRRNRVKLVESEPASKEAAEPEAKEVPDQKGGVIADVTWDERGVLAKRFDGEQFNLKDKSFRRRTVSYLRTHFNSDQWGAQKVFLEDAGLDDKQQNWFGSVGRGTGALYRAEMEGFAKACGLTVYQLLCKIAEHPMDDSDDVKQAVSTPEPAEEAQEASTVTDEVDGAEISTESADDAPVTPEESEGSNDEVLGDDENDESCDDAAAEDGSDIIDGIPAEVSMAEADIPDTSDEDEIQAHFKKLVLSANTQDFVPDLVVGDYTAAIQADDVDWVHVYMTYMKDGVEQRKRYLQLESLFKDEEAPVQKLWLLALEKISEP